LEDRCVGNQAALLVKISVRFKHAPQGKMHDLRHRRCPIIAPTLLCLKWPRLGSLLWSQCQLECKITARNKISHKDKLLACDLMWKICAPLLASVNSWQKGEHPLGSRVNYVPAGGRNPTPPQKAIIFARQARNKPLSNMATEMVLRRTKIENATVHGFRSSFRDWAARIDQFGRHPHWRESGAPRASAPFAGFLSVGYFAAHERKFSRHFKRIF